MCVSKNIYVYVYIYIFEQVRAPPAAAGLFLEPTQRSTQRFVRIILATTMLRVILAGGYANLHRKNLLHFSVPVLKGVLPSTFPLAVPRQPEKNPAAHFKALNPKKKPLPSQTSDVVDLVEEQLRVIWRHVLRRAHHGVAAISDL